MRISLVGPVYPYRGGIAHYTASLAQALVSRGHEVQLISFRRQYPRWLYPGQDDKDPSQHKIDQPSLFLLDPLLPTTWFRTARAIEKFHPDRIALNWWTTFWAPSFSVLAWKLTRKIHPLIFLIHNVYPHDGHFYDRVLTRSTLRWGDRFIVHAPRQADRLRQLLPRASIQECPLPDFTLFQEQRIPKSEARRRLGLPEDAPVLLFFGIIRPYKGLGLLVDALCQPKLAKKAHLIIAGEFWESRQKYELQASSLGLSDRVHIYDRYIPNEEVPLYFSAADVLVAPYIQGTQSAAIHWALGFGLPVIASQSITDERLIELEGKRSWLFPPGDLQGLVDSINTALAARPIDSTQPGDVVPDGWDRLVKLIVTQPG